VATEFATESVMNFIYDNLDYIIYICFLTLLTIIAAQIVRYWFNKQISKTRMVNQTKATKLVMIKHIILAGIYVFGFMLVIYMFPPLRALSATIFASAGLISIIIGIAAQDTFGNLISGITLAFFQPFAIGDFVTIGTTYGEVIAINLRHTTIRVADNRHVLIPNSNLNKETIINWTNFDPSSRCTVYFKLTLESDIDIARKIMIEEARKNKSIMFQSDVFRLHPDVTEDVRVRVTDLNTGAMELRLDFWVYNKDDAYSTETTIREAIKKRFDEEPAVSLAYNHTTIFTDESKTSKTPK